MSNPTLAPPTTSIQTINISTSELQRISILVYQYIRISVYQHFSHQYISSADSAHQYISTSAYQHHLFCYYFNISSPVLELFSGAARWRRLFSKQANKQTSKQANKQTSKQANKQKREPPDFWALDRGNQAMFLATFLENRQLGCQIAGFL